MANGKPADTSEYKHVGDEEELDTPAHVPKADGTPVSSRRSLDVTVQALREQARNIGSTRSIFGTNGHQAEDQELQSAAAEAYERWRAGGGESKTFKPRRLALLPEETSDGSASGKYREVDVKKLSESERKTLTSRAMATQDPDYGPFLRRLHHRMEKVGITLSTVEVRFEGLDIETDVFVGSRALPSVTNAFLNYAQKPFDLAGIKFSSKHKFPILKHMSGVLKPGRFTLLLGPPGSGKSTLLKALSGKLEAAGLRIGGRITYNGHTFDEFTVRRTASYIEQRDVHMQELSVQETLDFAARCQGTGHKALELQQLMEREAKMGIVPDPEIDAFMKADAQAGTRYSITTELILRLLGLDYVADTLIGGEMIRGISGGQKKRVTTGEMIVGQKKTLMMDEISTGLDSSTTFQIVQMIRDFCHLRSATVLMALLQPAPEVYDLFDDILFLSEGQIVFHGPREEVLPFFSSMGFQLPERKGIADFLQEVTSRKDQAQYWAESKAAYRYVSVPEFAAAFQKTPTAQRTHTMLEMPYDKAASPEGSLAQGKYGLPLQKILRATLRRELVLVQRNAFIYVFRSFQMLLVSVITATLFIRTRIHPTNIPDANLYLGVIFYGLIGMMFNSWAEFQLQVDRLPVFYKQRDNLFYPAWAFHLPVIILNIPQAIFEAGVWSCIVYWVVGLAPSAGRFFAFWLFHFLVHQFSVAMFRLVGAFCQTSTIANATSVVVTMFILINGGYVLPRPSIRWWWRWIFYINPIAWAQRSTALNEFQAPRWDRPLPGATGGPTLGETELQTRGFAPETSHAWLWTAIPAMLGITAIVHFLIILSLQYLQSPDKPGSSVVTEEEVKEKHAAVNGTHDTVLDTAGNAMPDTPTAVEPGSAFVTSKRRLSIDRASSGSDVFDGKAEAAATKTTIGQAASKSTLPFEQLWLTFHHVWYSVDLPSGMEAPANPKNEGAAKPRLYLLNDVSGCFRPNVLTALIGETGAGKTTLMDVLALRKTAGIIEGDVRVQGHPQVPATFPRVSGYIEQNDIHSPNTTVHEALLFSAQLRLPGTLDTKTVRAFVDEIMGVVELTPLRDALVGLPGRTGLSVEQRKRLTIAVELVANPSIVFMDEPTSGLDARAAAIVMRAVRNTVDTGRTVVCTIHQPSIDIFESFDELVLMRRGGRISYNGPLGDRSAHMVAYFQGYDGVPKCRDGYNPATWVLEVTNQSAERHLDKNFADLYEQSDLYKRTETLVADLSDPPEGSKPLHFESRYSRGLWAQFRVCLWKNQAMYWRNPDYNSIRFLFTLVLAFIIGTSFWGVGSRRDTQNNVLAVAGALFLVNMFLGAYNCSSVQPVVSTERSVYYRERSAGMYSSPAYVLAQGVVELPYILVQAVMFIVLVYAMLKFEWTAAKFFWFLFFEILSLLFFLSMGIVSIALTPNLIVASIICGTCYFLLALFLGFVIQAPRIPGWWIWLYYLDPLSWVLYGSISSQLGDVTSMMTTSAGEQVMVSQFITDFFGFHHNLLGVCVAVLFGMITVCWIGIAWAAAKLNWEKR